jgi:hypothetical protein
MFPASLLAAEAILQQLIASVNSVLASADQVLRNRLEDAQTRAENLLREVDKMRQQGVTDINNIRAKFFEDVHGVIAATSSALNEQTRSAFLGANQILISIASMLDQLPFVKIKPYVITVEPRRIRADVADRMAFLYGYFPKADKGKLPAIDVEGERVEGKLFAGHKVGFEIPSKQMTPESFVQMKVQIKFKDHWWDTDTVTFNERIWVENDDPFGVVVRFVHDNPAAWKTVTGSFEAHANSNTTSVVRNMSARDMFTSTVSSAAEYDLESVTFSNIEHRLGAGRPCEHVTADARFDGWDAHSVRFSLQAGSIGAHLHGSGLQSFVHGGGGSNADIWITAHHRAKSKAIPGTIESDQKFRLGRGAVNELLAGRGWQQIHVDITFADGDDKWHQTVVLVPTNRSHAAAQWTARVEGEGDQARVVVSTMK